MLAARRGDAAVARTSRATRVTARDITLRAPKRPTAAQIRKIRNGLGLSQAVFGELLNVSASTIRAWEQGQRLPDGPSLRLLEVAEHEPSALLELATHGVARTARRRTRDRGKR
ncbi:MAG: helix-turn-helix domain-containing protein [Longimicrobiales bacterium]